MIQCERNKPSSIKNRLFIFLFFSGKVHIFVSEYVFSNIINIISVVTNHVFLLLKHTHPQPHWTNLDGNTFST